MRAAEAETDPDTREILREAALRAAIIDTPWSAAFISYVVRQGGVGANAFKFSNAHRAYIYDAFAATVAEQTKKSGEQLYRACPLTATKPRPGDLVCQQREPSLADASEEAVRERIRSELGGSAAARSVRRTHCDVVASCRCQSPQGLCHRRQRRSGRHRQEAEPAGRPEIFRGAAGPLRRRRRLDPAPGSGQASGRPRKRRPSPRNAR